MRLIISLLVIFIAISAQEAVVDTTGLPLTDEIVLSDSISVDAAGTVESDSTSLPITDEAVSSDSITVDSISTVLTEDLSTDTTTISDLTSDAAPTADLTDSLAISEPDPAIVSDDSEDLVEPQPDRLILPAGPIGPLPMELSYGYKGFRWGSPVGIVPHLEYADSIISSDSTSITLKATLGPDVVLMTYHFADSGFWKVDIEFDLLQNDIDTQIKHFLRIEKSMAEIYGPPASTNQIFSGPSPSYNDILDVNFSRAFYRSGWSPIPVRIELLLSGIVQHSGSVLPVFRDNISVLRMVYYNPGYMHFTPLSDRAEKIPSIFELY